MKRKLNQRQVSCWCSSITCKSSTSIWEMIIHPFKLDFQAFPRLPRESCSEGAIFGIWGNSMGSVRGGRPRLGKSLLTDDQNQDDKWKFLLLDKQGPVLLLYVNVCLRYGRWASLWASRQAGQRWWARPRRHKYRARTALPTGQPALSHVLPVPSWKSAGQRTISLARTFLVLSLSSSA